MNRDLKVGDKVYWNHMWTRWYSETGYPAYTVGEVVQVLEWHVTVKWSENIRGSYLTHDHDLIKVEKLGKPRIKRRPGKCWWYCELKGGCRVQSLDFDRVFNKWLDCQFKPYSSTKQRI